MNSAATRVLSALVLIPFVLGVIWMSSPWGTRSLVLVVAGIGVGELMKLVSPPRAVVLGAIYLVVPLLMLVDIRESHGPGVLMILLGTVVASDSGQYYTGRAFGRHKLAPAISPSKTVEGAVGGVVIASIAAVLLGRVWLPAVAEWRMAPAGAVIAIAGIFGDLFESRMKRRAGVKDSGHLIPGHGGILDRIDSWLFATPVYWVFLRLWS